MSESSRYRLFPIPIIALALSTGLHLLLVLIPLKPVQHFPPLPPVRLTVEVEGTSIPLTDPRSVAGAKPIEEPSPTFKKNPEITSPRTPDKSYLAVPDHYFEVNELDRIPHPLKDIQPRFPSTNKTYESSIQTKIAVYLDEEGKVVFVSPESPSVDPEFIEAAKSAFESAMFEPGMIQGLAVKTVLKINVRFEPSNDNMYAEPSK